MGMMPESRGLPVSHGLPSKYSNVIGSKHLFEVVTSGPSNLEYILTSSFKSEIRMICEGEHGFAYNGVETTRSASCCFSFERYVQSLLCSMSSICFEMFDNFCMFVTNKFISQAIGKLLKILVVHSEVEISLFLIL